MIVDAHTHLGSVAGFYIPCWGPEAMLDLMDTLGIDVAVQIEHGGLFECFEEAYAASRTIYQASGGRASPRGSRPERARQPWWRPVRGLPSRQPSGARRGDG